MFGTERQDVERQGQWRVGKEGIIGYQVGKLTPELPAKERISLLAKMGFNTFFNPNKISYHIE